MYAVSVKCIYTADLLNDSIPTVIVNRKMCSTFFYFTDLSPSKETLAWESTTFLLGSARLSCRFARRNLDSTTSQWEQLLILEKTNPEIIKRAALIILKNLRRFSFFCKDYSDLFVLTYSHLKFTFYLPKYLFDLILGHVIIVIVYCGHGLSTL